MTYFDAEALTKALERAKKAKPDVAPLQTLTNALKAIGESDETINGVTTLAAKLAADRRTSPETLTLVQSVAITDTDLETAFTAARKIKEPTGECPLERALAAARAIKLR